MSKLAAAIAATVLAVTAPRAHADVVEPTQDSVPAPAVPAPAAAVEPAPAPAVDPAGAPATAPAPRFESWTADGEVPPLTGGRLLAEAGLGTAFALGGGVGGAFIGASIEVRNGCHQDLCGFAGGLVGGAIGLAVATPVGVYIAGTAGDQTGSLGAAFAGSLAGSVLGIGLAAGLGGDAGVPMLFAGPVIGSMIGFNLTRDYSPSHKKRSRVVVPVASANGERTTFGLAGAF
jgi:hypothetical protein